jgi:hypothetical protein
MTSAETLKGRIDRAAERAEAAKSKLYKPDGSKLYSDAEHAERMEAIAGEVAREAKEADEEAGRIAAAKEEELYRYRHGCPTEDLLEQQLEAANARRVFVQEDCEELPLEELTKRLRGLLAGAKKETVWLYARYARRRADRTSKLLEDQGTPLPARAELSAQLRSLEEVLKGAEERNRSTFNEREAAEAEKELEEVREAKRYIGRRWSEADGSAQRARHQHQQMFRRAL